MSKIKQVIVIRADLKMRRGKEIAQGSHASMKVFFDKMSQSGYSLPVVTEGFFGKKEIIEFKILYDSIDPTIEWINGSFTKVVVSCNSEEELLNLQTQADEAGIVNALIQDNGETEFKENCPNCGGTGLLNILECARCDGTGRVNKKTYTALAIGPDYSDKIDKITGNLKLR